MSDKTYPVAIISQLREARIAQKMSQRELSAKVGLPQSHISNIESGKVDLKTSNLVEIARCLDLEVMLVPRPLITTVKALSQQGSILTEQEAEPAYRLDEEN
ncbi:MAG: transcriptional regulator [Legionellales bacterium]|nr:transcriptional regulator [Legionellales bacterium]|tara:strand:- start:45291 stop:45596 length:306 start_codon:yes stop_codon:yes gene_type:complete